MKKLISQLNFAQLTKMHLLIKLVMIVVLTLLMVLTLPTHSAEIVPIWADGLGANRVTYNDKKPAPAGISLYLCLKVKKGKLAEELSSGPMPWRYKWFRYIGTTPYFQETQTPKKQSLNENNFQWKLWGAKHKISKGRWRVDIVYANNQPVMCGKQPCRYSIRVK